MREKGKNIVKRCCSNAKEARIEEGMSLEYARMRQPDSIVFPCVPEKSFQLLLTMAKELQAISPRSGLDNDLRLAAEKQSLLNCCQLYDGLVIDLEGTFHLHQTPTALANRIGTILLEAGITCHIAFGPTIGSAWALSRSTALPTTSYVPALNEALPVSYLRIPEITAEELYRLGITSIAGVLDFPVKELHIRFGAILAHRIEQFLGIREERVVPVYESPFLLEEETFEPALSEFKGIEQKVYTLSNKLICRLQQQGLIARSFRLQIECIDIRGKSYRVVKNLSFHRPAYKFEQLEELLKSILHTLSFPGAVAQIIVEARNNEPAGSYQRHITESAEKNQADSYNRDIFINHLTTTLGVDAVRQLHYHDSFLPECTASFQPFSGVKKTVPAPLNIPVRQRPSYLLDNPEPIEATALLPDRPPVRLQWEGNTFSIKNGYGPERLHTEWWRSGSREQRDYFTVQDQFGRWLWIYRLLPSHTWFLHGIWT